MAYNPSTYQGDPKDSQQFLEWVLDEFGKVQNGMFDLDSIRFVTQYRAPTKPRTGDTLLADGSSWNPGSGAGVYTYYAAAWHKLG